MRMVVRWGWMWWDRVKAALAALLCSARCAALE